jgi:hypothetical protein
LIGFTNYTAFLDTDCNYKLKKLRLEGCAASPDFIELLLIHQDTLENVKLKGIVNTSLINQLINLRKVKLNIDLGSLQKPEPIQELPNVTSLTISCCNLTTPRQMHFGDFDGKFPNLKELRLTKFGSFKPTAVYGKLESFTLESSVMQGPLNAPKMKIYKCEKVTFQMLRLPFSFNNNVLERVTVKDCLYAAWVYFLLRHPRTKLHTLEFYNRKSRYVNDNLVWQKAIKDNRQKVKHIKVKVQ